MKLGAILGAVIGILYLIAGCLYFNFNINKTFIFTPLITCSFLVQGALIGSFFKSSGNKNEP